MKAESLTQEAPKNGSGYVGGAPEFFGECAWAEWARRHQEALAKPASAPAKALRTISF